MVVHPHDSDKGKTDEEGCVGWPLAGEGMAQLPRRGRGDANIKNEQGDGDGVNAIRESFDAARFGGHEIGTVNSSGNYCMSSRCSEFASRFGLSSSMGPWPELDMLQKEWPKAA